MLPKVSVIIPTYNRAEVIGRAIKSVLNQTYQNFEIIIVDDSPDDETEKVVKIFNDKRIKYIHNREKTTPPAARNLAIKNSNPKSEYIAFLDDDDEWLPQFLERCIQKLEERKDLIAVIPNYIHVSADGTKIGESNEVKQNWNTGIGNGAVIRKSLFIKENIWYDPKVIRPEDWDFALRVLKNHKIESISEPLVIYYHSDEKRKTLSKSGIPPANVEYFFNKHISYFLKLRGRPLAFFYFYIGKLYARSGEIRKGKSFFLKAFFHYPNPIYIIYYLFWSFPKFAKNFYSEELRCKILKIYGKIIKKY